AGGPRRWHHIGHDRLSAPDQHASGSVELPGEHRVRAAGDAEPVVEAQTQATHRPEVEEDVVGGCDGHTRSGWVLLAREELSLDDPAVGTGWEVGDHRPHDGVGTRL